MFRTIVVAVDHSDGAEAAVLHGAVLARQAGARLQLMTVRPSDVDAMTLHGRLDEIADRLDVDADIVVTGPDDVAVALGEVAGRPDTLLCLRTHARRPVAEMVMGSVAFDVAHRASCPVLVLRPGDTGR